MNRWIAVASSITLMLLLAGEEKKQWRGGERYQTIMWSTATPKDLPLWIQRLQEMECSAAQCYRGTNPERFAKHGFGFYMENLVPELAFLHNRKKLYDEGFRKYLKTRHPRHLVRKPCLHDPSFWKKVEPSLQKLVRPCVPYHPLLYNLQDELSIGSFASPMDYCFGAHTLSAFRKWLKVEYPSLNDLNAEWNARFPSWDGVIPFTTDRIKERERRDMTKGLPVNYAPWADHRAFMDLSFSRAIQRLREIVGKADPNVPIGIEGTQMPSAWGGFDLWLLSQAIDWVEPYDIGNSREIFRSFLPGQAPILSTIFGSDLQRIGRSLWRLLLHGDRGCIIWEDEKSRCIQYEKKGMNLTSRGKELARLFAELKDVAPLLLSAQRITDPIAVHYSQASIRAHWMFDSREDGQTWIRRFSSYEASHSRFARVRDSFVRLIEDLGLQYRFLSYAQIENGCLLKEKYKVLLLPQSVAMSSKECSQIEAFVRGGGTVIADNMTARMNEHCRGLSKGQLDDLFGIKQKGQMWRPRGTGGYLPSSNPSAAPLLVFDPQLTLTAGRPLRDGLESPLPLSQPVIIAHSAGKGRAIFLNLDMHNYGAHRLSPPKGINHRNLFERILFEAGLRPHVRVLDTKDRAPLPGVEVWRYNAGDIQYVALMRNPEPQAGSLRAMGYPDKSSLEEPASAIVEFPTQRKITNERTGEKYGETEKITVRMDPWSPLILKLE